jgi:hypothetical protein
MENQKFVISLRKDELEDMISSLIFAYNNGKTSEEFGSHCLIKKLEKKLSGEKEFIWDSVHMRFVIV